MALCRLPSSLASLTNAESAFSVASVTPGSASVVPALSTSRKQMRSSALVSSLTAAAAFPAVSASRKSFVVASARSGDGPTGPIIMDSDDEGNDVIITDDDALPDDILETLAKSSVAQQAAVQPPAGPSAAQQAEDTAQEAAAAEAEVVEEKRQMRQNLKLCLLDSLYATERGFRASGETRAEVAELVAQLEAENPTDAPTESPDLDGTWVLAYTYGELLPLLAAGQLPLLTVGAILQTVDVAGGRVSNAISFQGPLTETTIKVDATFEVRSSKRLQVKFEQVTFSSPQPLEGDSSSSSSSSSSLPPINLFGQSLDLSSLSAALQPIQQAAVQLAKMVSGVPPLALPIDGERAQGWQLLTYLDEDFRIARGDAGSLFVMVRQGSPLLE